jgi:hypothetical protein
MKGIKGQVSRSPLVKSSQVWNGYKVSHAVGKRTARCLSRFGSLEIYGRGGVRHRRRKRSTEADRGAPSARVHTCHALPGKIHSERQARRDQWRTAQIKHRLEQSLIGWRHVCVTAVRIGQPSSPHRCQNAKLRSAAKGPAGLIVGQRVGQQAADSRRSSGLTCFRLRHVWKNGEELRTVVEHLGTCDSILTSDSSSYALTSTVINRTGLMSVKFCRLGTQKMRCY